MGDFATINLLLNFRRHSCYPGCISITDALIIDDGWLFWLLISLSIWAHSSGCYLALFVAQLTGNTTSLLHAASLFIITFER